MSHRKWLFVGVLLVAALLTWLGGFLSSSAHDVVAASTESTEEATRASSSITGLPIAEPQTAEIETPEEDRRESLESELPVESDASVALVEARLSVFTLSGRVVLQDASGVELPAMDGRLELRVLRGNRGTALEIDVDNGAWSTEIPNSDTVSRLSIKRLRTDAEELAVLEPVDSFVLPDDSWLEIRGSVPRRAVLRVVDSRDGHELAGITLVGARSFPYSECTHPSTDFDDRAWGRDLASPIDLDLVRRSGGGSSSHPILVGARDYAWTTVAIDFKLGGERTLALEPGGDLEVHLEGYDPRDHAELRLRRAVKEHPFMALVPDGGRVFLEGLAAGQCLLSMEVGNWWDSRLVLGEASVEIVAGVLVQATLVLEAAPEPETATMSGLALVPEGWPDNRLVVTAELMGTPLAGFDDHQRTLAQAQDSERAGLRAYRFEFGKMQVGRYELGLHRPAFSIVVDLPPGGRDDFVLELPPPAELRVRVLDASTGEDVVTQKLHWHPRPPEGVLGGGLERAQRDAETGLYRILAPAMPIELSLWDWGYRTVSESVDLSPGTTEHTLRLEPACGIYVTLKDGDTSVAFPDEFYGRPEPAPGTTGRTGLSSYGKIQQRYQVTEPGTYVLELPALSGYKKPEPQTIEVQAGDFVDHVVPLERAHD